MKIENELSLRTRVALYIRVSTEEQALHGLSIESQTEALDDWAEKNHVQVVGRYTRAFDSSGSKKRPKSIGNTREIQSNFSD